MISAISTNSNFLSTNSQQKRVREDIGMNIAAQISDKYKVEEKKDNSEGGYFIDLIKIKAIAIKIARDERVTAKEIAFLREESPEILQKAKIAKNQAKQIEFLKKSDNNPMKESIQAYVEVLSMSDPQFGELFAYASNKYKDSATMISK